MTEWFKRLPKAMFVTIVLSAGVLFVVISDPPRTLCDSQLDIFKNDTNDFLGVDPNKALKKISRFSKLIDTCKMTNSPGGCYELFHSLKTMMKEVRSVSPECYTSLTSNKDFNFAVWESLDLMVRIAWGSEPPATMALRAGWFSPADLNLFCELKSKVIQIYSERRWNEFAEQYFSSLPQADKSPRAESWQKMLFSVNCASYL